MKLQTIWAKYPGDARYLVSIDGGVINLDWQRRGKAKRVKLSGTRPSVNIEFVNHRVSRMAADSFNLPGTRHQTLVCHKNDISSDNRIENLYRGTHTENLADAFLNGVNPGRGIGVTLTIDGEEVEYKTIRDAAEAGGHSSQQSVLRSIRGEETSFPYKARYTNV